MPTKYSPELRERTVRMVHEHRDDYGSEWECMSAIAELVGPTPETVRKWDRQDEVDTGRRDGVTSEDRERIRALERENRELKRANAILLAAGSFFGVVSS